MCANLDLVVPILNTHFCHSFLSSLSPILPTKLCANLYFARYREKLSTYFVIYFCFILFLFICILFIYYVFRRHAGTSVTILAGIETYWHN